MKTDLTINEHVLPCPLCTSPAFLHTVTANTFDEPFFWVKCDDLQCGCTIASVRDRALALSIWNRRGQ